MGQKAIRHIWSYGGRGITICDEWSSFAKFAEDMGNKPPGMTLGRIDNDAGYSKENCRWETMKQQARNRRNTRYVEAFGERLCLQEWSDIYGISDDTLRFRLKKGMSAELALSQPVNTPKRQQKQQAI
jgi:hypothetical protein